MIMVVHQALGVADPIISFVDVLEGVQKVDPILLTLKNGLLFITPGGNVIDCAGISIRKGRAMVKRYHSIR